MSQEKSQVSKSSPEPSNSNQHPSTHPGSSLQERRIQSTNKGSKREETIIDEIFELSPEQMLPAASKPEKNFLTSLLPSEDKKSLNSSASKKKKKRGLRPRALSQPVPQNPQVQVQVHDTDTAKRLLFFDTAVQNAETVHLATHSSIDPQDTAVDHQLDPNLLETLREHQRSGGQKSYFDAPSTPAPILEPSIDPEATKALRTAPQNSTHEPPPVEASIRRNSKRSIALRPSNLKDRRHKSVGNTMTLQPVDSESSPTQKVAHSSTQSTTQIVHMRQHNQSVLERFQEQSNFAYVHFSPNGRMGLPLQEHKEEDIQFVFPKSDKERLASMSVPIGWTQDDRGQLCESHLVLAKALQSAPIWSRAIAELKPAPDKTVRFQKWLRADPEDLAQLTDAQKTQLYFLLDAEAFMRFFRGEEQAPLWGLEDHCSSIQKTSDSIHEEDALSLTDDDIVHTNPKHVRVQQTHDTQTPPFSPTTDSKGAKSDFSVRNSEVAHEFLDLFQSTASTSTETEADAPPGVPSLPSKTPEKQKPYTPDTTSGLPRPLKRDDTGMRRVHIESAPLEPNDLRLHIKIPRRFLGKWFQGTEETLSVYGEKKELKLPTLGLSIRFSFAQTESGKVFPQVILMRSANIRDIPYAHHGIELFANRNPETSIGWDHNQTLERGHVAQFELSPTDQIRGILFAHIHHPKSQNIIDSLHLSWSIEE